MAVYDASLQKLVVRVVYDGPVQAGKTTNLRQLTTFFTLLRRSEIFVPGEFAGRTLFFDWLHLDAGLVGGHSLRCQLVTVPGQMVLNRRRRRILSTADVVIFVCESTPSGVEVAGTMLDAWRKRLSAEGAPYFVVQANKQDLVGALSPEAVAKALALPAEVPIVSARAAEGVGVRETLVVAIRAAADRSQRQLLEGGLEALAGQAESGEELHRALLAEQAADPTPAVMAVLAAARDGLEPPAGESVGPPPASATPARAAESVSERSAERADPPFPVPDVPSGHIWPGATGRDVLRSLPLEDAGRRPDLVDQRGTAEGSGTSDTIIYRAREWCLKTSPRRLYRDVDDARAAILALVRKKLLLGSLRPEDTVIALREDGPARLWLWTVCPWMATLRGLMEQAKERGDEMALATALTRFADAAVRSLQLAVRSGLALDVHPSNFGAGPEGVCYLDDDIGEASRIPAIGYALLRRVEEYQEMSRAREAYLAALEEALPQNLSAAEARALDLGPAIEHAQVKSAAAAAAQQRLGRAVWRCT